MREVQLANYPTYTALYVCAGLYVCMAEHCLPYAYKHKILWKGESFV